MKTILVPIDSSKELPEIGTSIPSHGIRVSKWVWTNQGTMMLYDFKDNNWRDSKDINPRHYNTETIVWYKELEISDYAYEHPVQHHREEGFNGLELGLAEMLLLSCNNRSVPLPNDGSIILKKRK